MKTENKEQRRHFSVAYVDMLAYHKIKANTLVPYYRKMATQNSR